MHKKITELANTYQSLAADLLREAIRIPTDHLADDPQCGLSNHEGPRLEYLRDQIIALGAVDSEDDIGFDGFGNLLWTVHDPEDGIDPADKVVVLLDGHTDTVQALRHRWHEAIGGGIDPYDGLTDIEQVDRQFLASELGILPPADQWNQLIWGRGSADQLGGVICQIIATKILLELRSEGALRGVIVRSYATVAEEDNDGGGPMYIMRTELANGSAERIPDVVILTEGTGCSDGGALGIYRGQRGRMQIEVSITGKSCHGSMPHEGRNPLEFGARILGEATDQALHEDFGAGDPFLGPGTRTASDARLETPSDCAVPERFVFRFDRRLAAGEDPDQAIAEIATLPAVESARQAGLEVTVTAPTYRQPTWCGTEPGNPQIYPGWVTPEDHPAIRAAVDAYDQTIGVIAASEANDCDRLQAEPRVSRWVFSTDGVGFPVRHGEGSVAIPATKQWVQAGPVHYPAMFGIGPGCEQNTHKIGECVDRRELAPCIAFLARFPRLYQQRLRSDPARRP